MLFKRAALAALLMTGCGWCGDGLSAGGVTPFERCLATEPGQLPAAIGPLKLSAQGRVLVLNGLPPEPRIAVFQGPGMPTALDSAAAFAALAQSKPDLVLMLGGLGLDLAAASALLSGVTKAGPPVLFLAGGRDSSEIVAAAREALPPEFQQRFGDLTGFHAVKLSGYIFALVAGSETGRSAISDAACGFEASDLEPIQATVTEAGSGKRLLVSWEIPGGSSLATVGGQELGSAALGKLRQEIEAKAGLYAWPDVEVMRPTSRTAGAVAWGNTAADLELVVPRICGPAHVRADGTRQSAMAVLIRLTSAGLASETPR